MSNHGNLDLERIYNDLSEECKLIASFTGMEDFIKIVRRLGGGRIYIPALEGLSIPDRNKKIAEGYLHGKNVSQLSSEFSICNTTVIKILHSNGICLHRGRPIKKE